MSDRMEEQLTLWEYISDRYYFQGPIILLEMFAGIGAQRKALSILGVEIDDEKSKICEWAYNSYCGYNAIHIKDKTDYSQGMTKEKMVERIKGTSINYNEPLTLEQLNKKNIEWIRNAYNNCEATHNLINIMEVKGKDLGELPIEQTSILCYSFPCQDLSLVGTRGGMSTSQAQGGTRSGLLWEVERILDERKASKMNLPTVLVMENVPEVVGAGNIEHFKKWEQKLRELGYSNYVDILNAKHFGIPQGRRRCFMVSILGDYAYDFPCKVRLKHRLHDLLETKVDEKYILSDVFLDYASGKNYDNKKFNRTKMFMSKLKTVNIDGIAGTITTREGGRSNDTFVIQKIGYIEKGTGEHQSNSVYSANGLSPTLAASDYKEPIKIMIGNYGNGHHAKDVFSADGIAPTITTGNHGLGQAVAINQEETLKRLLCNKLIEEGYVEEGDIVKHSYTAQILSGNKKAVEKSGDMITLTTRGDCFGITVNDLERNGLLIRKLLPVECMLLMGFTREDTKALYDIGLSDAAIWHVAGDSIVTTVLVAIFSKFVYIKNTHNKIIEEYVQKEILNNGTN